MKKVISLFLALVICLSLCACGKSASSEATNTPIVTQDTSPNVLPEETTVPVETEPETTAPLSSGKLSGEQQKLIFALLLTAVIAVISVMGAVISRRRDEEEDD